MTNGRRETSMRLPPIASRSSRPGPIMVTSVPSACTVAISRSALAVTLGRSWQTLVVDADPLGAGIDPHVRAGIDRAADWLR